TGCVYERRQPGLQSESDGHEGVAMDDLRLQNQLAQTRRYFLGRAGIGIGAAALAHLLNEDLRADEASTQNAAGGLPGLPHFAPKAKRVIYLFQGGGPAQMDLFDFKPELKKRQGTDLPDSVRNGQRLTSMSATQASFPVAPSIFSFSQYGKSGAWVSEVLPHT